MKREPDPTGLLPISDFDGARSASAPQDRLRALRRGAARFREQFLEAPPVQIGRAHV